MLVCLFSLACFVFSAWGKTFEVPVILNTKRPHEINHACANLKQRAVLLWKSGAFSKCVLAHSPKANSGRLDVSFKIVVDSEKLGINEKTMALSEVMAFVNRFLNTATPSCQTSTGPNWDTQPDDRNVFEVSALMVEKNYSGSPTCHKIEARAAQYADGQILQNCKLEATVSSNATFKHMCQLQLRRNVSYWMPSSGVFKALRKFSKAINTAIVDCLYVNRVNIVIESGVAVAEIRASFSKANFPWLNGSGCEQLRLTFQSGCLMGFHYECTSLQVTESNGNVIHYEVIIKTKLKVAVVCNIFSQNTDLFALNIEKGFNSKSLTCITYQASSYQKTYQGNPTAIIYGLYASNLCAEMENIPGYLDMYDSCTMNKRTHNTQSFILTALYSLQIKKPFYKVDLALYNKWLHALLTELNNPHSSCVYNGYIDTQ